MENYNYMKIKKSKLFTDSKDFLDSFFMIREVSNAISVNLNDAHDSDIDLEYLDFQLSKIQTNLTRAKKFLREIKQNTKS